MEATDLSVYLVTGRYDFSLGQFLTIIDTACRAGVTMVQLREKEITTLAYYKLAKEVKKITDCYQVPLMIDDRVDICLAVDAAGVHIGDEDLPVACVREILGKEKIVGVSAKSVSRALEAEREGADYLGVGAIFPTQTKVKTKATSLDTLRAIVAQTKLPIVAIGGITEARISAFRGTGISGIAAVSEIMLAEKVNEKVANLISAVKETKF